MPARLVIHFVDRPSQVHLLDDGGAWLLGREPGCDLPLDDDRVSRRHARLEHRPEGWFVEDLDSKNGTLVDGRPTAAERRLPVACWLGFGGLLARFQVVSEQEARRDQARRACRWRTSLRLQRELDPSVGVQDFVARLLDSVLTLSGAERGCVLLGGGERELEVVALAGIDRHGLQAAEFGGSLGAIERALASGRPVTSADARADTLLSVRPSVAAGGIRALVCLPLSALGRTLGVIYADSRQPGARFDELDVEILEAMASHAALGLAAARLDSELEMLASRLGEEEAAALRAAGEEPSAARSITWGSLLALHRAAGD